MSIPMPTVRAEQGPYELCLAFATAAAGYFFLGEDASLHWPIDRLRLSDTQGGTIDTAVQALPTEGFVRWRDCPGYGGVLGAQNAVWGRESELYALAVRPKRTERLYYNDDAMDVAAVCAALDAGYPIVANGPLGGLYDLDETGSTRLTPTSRDATHAVCLLPDYQRRADGVYVRYINSFGDRWGDRGTGWVQLNPRLYQLHAIIGDLYDFGDAGGGSSMSVNTYSLRKHGESALSANFKVKEFRCHDGSDQVKVCDKLVAALQAIRSHFGKAVNISSAYRTQAYNKAIGGATNSQHLYGTAADIRVAGANPRDIARWVEGSLFGNLVHGLGLYDYGAGDKSGFVHIDTRDASKPAQWVQTRSSAPTGYRVVGSITRDHLGGGAVGGNHPTVRKGGRGEAVRVLQNALAALGYAPGVADGIFGARTEAAVRSFQRDRGLVADGIVGKRSWAALGI